MSKKMNHHVIKLFGDQYAVVAIPGDETTEELTEKLSDEIGPFAKQVFQIMDEKLVTLTEENKKLAKEAATVAFLTDENKKEHEKALEANKTIAGLRYEIQQLKKENDELKRKPETDDDEKAVFSSAKKPKIVDENEN